MLGLIYKLIVGSFHQHKWKVLHWSNILDIDGTKIGENYQLQCSECGELKQKKFY